MTRQSKDRCFTEEDFFNFVTRPSDASPDLERHLLVCAHCQEELAGLLRLLQSPGGPAQEPSPDEIDATLALIERANQPAQRPRSAAPRRTWVKWGAIAAVVVVGVALGSMLLSRFKELRRSAALYAEARPLLEDAYSPALPHGARLELPFPPGPALRDRNTPERLEQAKDLLSQALGARQDMVEARLGLGYVYLSQSKLGPARAEFQKVLDQSSTDPRALLGRGASLFEEASGSNDPAHRDKALKGALADFETVLARDPASLQARYNRVLALVESGRHEEALREIDAYLARESGSLWAEKLRTVAAKIRLNRTGALDVEVERAAAAEDRGVLERVAALVPHHVAKAIRNSLKNGLATDSRKLFWAASVLESSYAAATGDASYSRLIEWYRGLSPPDAAAKKVLDSRLQSLIDSQLEIGFGPILSSTGPLVPAFEVLRDDWQLVDLHHLRGNSFYRWSDFASAQAEYRRMLEAARRTGAADLIVRGLASIAAAEMEHSRGFDSALAALEEMKQLAAARQLDPWLGFACRNLGYVYLSLNRLDRSLDEYAHALSLGYRLADERVVVESLLMIAEVLDRTGRQEEARDFSRQAIAAEAAFMKQGAARPWGREKLGYYVRSRQAELALELGDVGSAEKRFLDNLGLRPPGLRGLKARNHFGLADVYLRQNKLDAARRELQAGRAEAAGLPELGIRADVVEGRLLRRAGATAGALALFDRSIVQLESMRKHVPSPDLRRSFLANRFEPYREAVSLAFSSGASVRALGYVDRAKSATLREHLLERRDRLVARGAARGPLPPGLVTLEYFFLSDRLLAFVTRGERVDTAEIALAPAEAERKTEALLDSIRRHDGPRFDAFSRELYDALIDPLSVRLGAEPIETLVILPDGALHALPFACLQERSGRFFIEQHSVAYAPSRSVLEYCLSLHRGSVPADGGILLLDGGANLTGSSQELALLMKLFGPRAILAESPEPSTISAAATRAAYIHFTGHATLIGGSPSLVLRSRAGETLLAASSIDRWNLPHSRLITLAACNTGIGPRSEGESPWGLLPAFLNAGAPAVLVTLLPVDDGTARLLTSRLYELLVRNSSSPAAALRAAQLEILRTSPQSRTDVLAWAPFVLVGDPR
jgi:CHAT domain-containing protein